MTSSGGHPEPGRSLLAEIPASESRWRQIFPGQELQLAALRRWVAALLQECPARDDVISVASELSANAIAHTASGQAGWFSVEITRYSSAVVVAVVDDGAPGEPRVIDDPDSEHGRGMLVVQELSARMGVYGDQRGRLVWAEICWGESDGVIHAPGGDPHKEMIHDAHVGLAMSFEGAQPWPGLAGLPRDDRDQASQAMRGPSRTLSGYWSRNPAVPGAFTGC